MTDSIFGLFEMLFDSCVGLATEFELFAKIEFDVELKLIFDEAVGLLLVFATGDVFLPPSSLFGLLES